MHLSSPKFPTTPGFLCCEFPLLESWNADLSDIPHSLFDPLSPRAGPVVRDGADTPLSEPPTPCHPFTIRVTGLMWGAGLLYETFEKEVCMLEPQELEKPQLQKPQASHNTERPFMPSRPQTTVLLAVGMTKTRGAGGRKNFSFCGRVFAVVSAMTPPSHTPGLH